MLRNTVATTLSYFYPFGNTPAICLTQNLPPEQPANLLLLGCGDVRNVLFTTYSSLGSRPLDFTCCDIEPAIIARNVLFFSLIIDHVDDEKISLFWNIYYHFRIDSASADLLDAQATALLKCSESLSSWNSSPYGQGMRFCDNQTLTEVRRIWRGYQTQVLDQEQIVTRREKLERIVERAKDVRKVFLGDSIQLTGARSAAPTGVQALKDLSDLVEKYWENGCLYTGKALSATSHLNPAILISGTRKPTLHYGSDPLLGFHLAPAYVPLNNSSLSYHTTSATKPIALDTAQGELRTWSRAFRQAYQSREVIVRFFSGDALSFAHTIQHVGSTQLTTAGWYNNAWSYTPLDLDSGDYGSPDGTAPTSFNIIDTSNLGDHLGTLNMLVATLPLLHLDPSSTIYTEILAQHEANVKATLKNILCGDFDTVSLLMGVNVVETWTNATSTESEQVLFDITSQFSEHRGQSSRGRQIRTQIPWKLAGTSLSPKIKIKPAELAKALYAVYQNMFGHEDPANLLSSINVSGIDKVSNPFYNRASFVAFLHLVKHHVETDWSHMVEELLTNIEGENALSVGRNYFQEFCGYLHLAGLYTSEVLSKNPVLVFRKQLVSDLGNWKTLPALLAVTVEVPRSKIDFFTKMDDSKRGSPSFCCSLQSNPTASFQWLNQFGVIQSGFGHVKMQKTNVTGEHQIHIIEDEQGWAGKSPLVVTFCVPTWILLREEDSTLVAVGFQATGCAVMTYLRSLGPKLQFFNTRIGDPKVHISRNLPHQRKPWSISPMLPDNRSESPLPTNVAQETLSVDFDDSGHQISSLTYKIEFHERAQEILAEKSTTVRTRQVSPVQLEIRMNEKVICVQEFPRPVSAARSKLRIARKSSYVEIIAPLLNPLGEDKIDTFIYPMSLSARSTNVQRYPVGLNTHTVNLDICPTIDVSRPNKLEWINFHVTSMLSGRERMQREGNASTNSIHDIRVDFKDGLFSMLMHSTGVQGHKARVFGLYKQAGGIDTMIFVSSVKLDLNDRVVVLDAAVIPLQHSMMQDPLVGKALSELQSKAPVTMIKVVDAELKVWKSILPALVERCRTWKHNQNSCEHIKHGQIPVPGGLEDASTPLCSCGVGQLPKNFMRGSGVNVSKLDQMLQKYATRIALSPVFYVPYVETAFDISRYGAPNLATRTHGSETARPTADVSDSDNCAACGRTEGSGSSSTNSGGLLKCGRCRAVKYCSKDCQKKHWKVHKLVCS